MNKKYFIEELEFLNSIPDPDDFTQSLISDFEEILNRVLPWETDIREFIGLMGSEKQKGAFIVTHQQVRIYRDEFPAYYFYLRNLFHTDICQAHSTMN